MGYCAAQFACAVAVSCFKFDCTHWTFIIKEVRYAPSDPYVCDITNAIMLSALDLAGVHCKCMCLIVR